MHTTFTSWKDHMSRLKREEEIRKEYEAELEEATKRLAEYQKQQVDTVRNVLLRGAEGAQRMLVQTCFEAFREEVLEKKRNEALQGNVKALENKLKTFAETTASNAKRVLTRMNDGNTESLKNMCWKAWNQFVEDYKKDKEMNDAVKLAEQKMNEFKSKGNDGAKSVLNRMSSANESGLVQTYFQAWAELYKEEKTSSEMSALLQSRQGQMSGFAARNKTSAMNEMNRMVWAQEGGTLVCIIAKWKQECRVEGMLRYGHEKNKKRKEQLQGVKGLFKSFATDLENGLKDGTPRVEPPKNPHFRNQSPR